MESWREVILHLSSVLRWEQNFFPGIKIDLNIILLYLYIAYDTFLGVIFGAVTFIYIFLWYLDLSLLTLWSLILLLITLIDFVYPMVSKFLFKPENWTGTHEKSYELIIQDLVDAKLKLCGAVSYLCTSKAEKSTLVRFILYLYSLRKLAETHLKLVKLE